MKKRFVVWLTAAALGISPVAAPVQAADSAAVSAEEMPEMLEDGIYLAEFKTDSSMFHANEATGGQCVLTVKDGGMTIHVPLASKGILNLFQGLKEDAEQEGAQHLAADFTPSRIVEQMRQSKEQIGQQIAKRP